MTECSIDGCERPAKARGWCSRHYGRWTRHGDPLKVAEVGRPASGRYPMRSLTCRICGATFRARHGRRCRACRRDAEYKKECCDCGAKIHPKATRCHSCQAKRMVGEAHPRWNGGRFVGSDGYAMLRVGPKTYVAEHRLVMERQLGRDLISTESVHHRNGLRDDNRPENLELWTSSQPAGQRVVDLLEWARQIIATYEPVEEIVTGPSAMS